MKTPRPTQQNVKKPKISSAAYISDRFPYSTDRLLPLFLELQEIAAPHVHQLEHASGVSLHFAALRSLLGEFGDDDSGLFQIALDVRDRVGHDIERAEAFKGARPGRQITGQIDVTVADRGLSYSFHGHWSAYAITNDNATPKTR
jgi:hypothetical protein